MAIMLSRTNVPSLLAPTLLALAVSLPLAAQDGIAPVIVCPVNDAGLTSTPVDAVANTSGAIFSLDAAVFTSGIYGYSLQSGFTTFSAGSSTVNGIAVTNATGNGTWEYSEDLGSTWTYLNELSEETAAVIPLSVSGVDQSENSYTNVTLVRYLPYSDANDEVAQLIFRAVDDVSASPTSTVNTDIIAETVYGGSPTGFSEVTRTLQVPVTGVNDAPVWTNSYYDYGSEGSSIGYNTPFVSGGGDPVQIWVSDLLSYAGGNDEESGSYLGIMLTGLSQMTSNKVALRRYGWGYNNSTETWEWMWFDITYSADDAILLSPDDLIEITPISGVSQKGDTLFPFQFHLWDQSSGSAGEMVTPSYGVSSPYSDGYGQVTVSLVNAPPVISADSWVVIFNQGTDSVSVPMTATDDSQVYDFGYYDGEVITNSATRYSSGIDLLFESIYSYSSVTTGTLTISNLTGKTKLVDTFDVAAVDDDNAYAYQSMTVYGNTAPSWADVSDPVELTIASDATEPLSTTFTINDEDVDNPVYYGESSEKIWDDHLSFGENGTEMTLYTDYGTAHLTLVPPSPPELPPAQGLPQSITIVQGSPFTTMSLEYTPDGGQNNRLKAAGSLNANTRLKVAAPATDNFTVTVYDANGLSADLNLSVAITAAAVNHAPIITAPLPQTTLGTVLGGTSAPLTAQATDVDGNTLTWSVATAAAHGTVTTSNAIGSSVSYVYTPTVGYSGPDSFTLQVDDGAGGTSQVTVSATVEANTPPVLVSTIGDGDNGQGPITILAIAGQPFLALIAGSDTETPQNVQVTISGTTPDGVAFTSSGTGFGSLQGIPTTPGVYHFALTLDDGVNVTTRQMSMTVVAPVLANVPPPTIPVSGPGNTVYGAFSPGSSANFQAVADILAGRPNTQSRAFWWDGEAGTYAELPVLPSAESRIWHAIWLASVTPVTLPTEVPAVAMPYAIDLVPGWTFFGLPPVTDGTNVSTTHGWTNCSLQTTTGVPLSAGDRAAVLGNADAGGPWAWDGVTYARTTSLTTGSGYWLYNRGSQAVRLVRGTSTTPSVTALAKSASTPDEQPPLPPNGATAASSESGGSCGAGSGMGLFTLAGMLAFLRFRKNRS